MLQVLESPIIGGFLKITSFLFIYKLWNNGNNERLRWQPQTPFLSLRVIFFFH